MFASNSLKPIQIYEYYYNAKYSSKPENNNLNPEVKKNIYILNLNSFKYNNIVLEV